MFVTVLLSHGTDTVHDCCCLSLFAVSSGVSNCPYQHNNSTQPSLIICMHAFLFSHEIVINFISLFYNDEQ